MHPSWIHFGRWFQTRLYHPALAGTPPEEGNWNHFGGTSLCRAETLIKSEFPYSKCCLKQARAGRFVP